MGWIFFEGTILFQWTCNEIRNIFELYTKLEVILRNIFELYTKLEVILSREKDCAAGEVHKNQKALSENSSAYCG